MTFIDSHVHMFSRTTDDYKLMSAAGIEAVVEPAFWLGSDRSSKHSFYDYFSHILETEAARAAKYGIHHFCCIGVNAKESDKLEFAMETVKGMEDFLRHPHCVAVGEIGYNNITENEEKVFIAQCEMAIEHKLPIVVHSPHFNKKKGIERIVKNIHDLGIDEDLVLIDHNTEETIPVIANTDFWKGFTLYPTKMSPERTVDVLEQYGYDKMIVNSSADWSDSDPLAVPKTGALMRQRRIPRAIIKKVLYDNPYNFYKKSGRFDCSNT
ncbi:MAG: TatD family hydrolase [Planctomycetota bacterium]|nr:TatD family hydrolase [Planctomycetota bacterium]